MPFLVKEKIIDDGQEIDMEWMSRAIDTLKERSKTLIELAKSLRYYIAEEIEYDEKAKSKFLNDKSRDLLTELKDGLESLDQFSESAIEQLFRAIVEKHDIKLGKLAQPVRVALTGGTQSPGIFEVIDVIGRDKTIKRLKSAIDSI
jgi:glutamyl-tRNA synthetase